MLDSESTQTRFEASLSSGRKKIKKTVDDRKGHTEHETIFEHELSMYKHARAAAAEGIEL